MAPDGHSRREKPVLLLETYLPRPDRMGAFVRCLLAELRLPRRSGDVPDPETCRVYRSFDGEAVVVISEFASAAAKDRWLDSERRRMREAQLRPLLEHALIRNCMLVHEQTPASYATAVLPRQGA